VSALDPAALPAAAEEKLAAAWGSIDDHDEAAFRALIDSLVADAPAAVADFERASAFDSTGHPDEAVPLYRSALAAGLTGLRRRRATIQLASSLRNLGAAPEAVSLLSAELAAAVDGAAAELDDAVRAFLALALVDVGRSREAAALALGALAPHLPRYQRSLGAYAQALGS
jgi:hypothetical protein